MTFKRTEQKGDLVFLFAEIIMA